MMLPQFQPGNRQYAAAGYARYDLPGGLEREREHDWTRDGIPLGREHREGLERIAAELGIPVPWQCGANGSEG